MKKLITITLLLALAVAANAQSISLSNGANGAHYLHRGAFGSFLFNGPTMAQIEHVEAQKYVSSFGYMSTPQMFVDINGLANGNPANNGATYKNGLIFGGFNSGELISSKRNEGEGKWGLDFATYWRNRMHIGNDGAVGVGTTNGQSPTKALDGRFNIHNYNSGEDKFYKNINLYTSASYDGMSDRVGIANHIWKTVRGNPFTFSDFWTEMIPIYGPFNITPKNTVGIINNMRNISAESLAQNPAYYNYTYGIMNDLNDQKIAGYSTCLPGIPCVFQYQPRIGLLNVTNTRLGSVNNVSYGSGKMGIWSVNIGGYSLGQAGTKYLFDGWAQWNDGQTFLRYGYVTASDEKLKQEVRSLNRQETLKKLMQLNPVQYEFKERPEITETGFLAQNLKEAFPEVVVNAVNPASKEELLGIQYQQMHSITIAAIQAQQELIVKLEKRVAELESKRK